MLEVGDHIYKHKYEVCPFQKLSSELYPGFPTRWHCGSITLSEIKSELTNCSFLDLRKQGEKVCLGSHPADQEYFVLQKMRLH